MPVRNQIILYQVLNHFSWFSLDKRIENSLDKRIERIEIFIHSFCISAANIARAPTDTENYLFAFSQ